MCCSNANKLILSRKQVMYNGKMPENAPANKYRNIAITTAAALIVGSAVGIEGPKLFEHYRSATECTYGGDSSADRAHMERFMTATLTDTDARTNEPMPTDFGLLSLNNTVEPLKSYIAFKKKVIHVGGVVRPIVSVDATYTQVKQSVTSIATAYGIHIDDSELAAKPAKLDSNNVKEAMISFGDFLTELPVETIEQTGLTTLLLEDNVDGNANVLGDIHTNNPNIMHLSIPKLNGSEGAETYDPAGAKYTFAHELYHIMDTSMCRGVTPKPIAVDPLFSSINRGHKYSEHATPMQYFFDSQNDFIQQEEESYHGDVLKSCVALADKTSGLVFSSNYAATKNAAEDKAETGLYTFFPGKYSEIMAMKRSAFRQKFINLMSRLYAYDPQSAQYLIHESAMSRVADQYVIPCLRD